MSRYLKIFGMLSRFIRLCIQLILYVAQFASRITEKLQLADQQEFAELQSPITKLFIGASAAENEFLNLSKYYVQTDEFLRVQRGEVQVVAGRKGSGKSALFFEVRNRIRSDRRNVDLDLHPEGFQLRKLKSLVLDALEIGTREHAITAFWEACDSSNSVRNFWKRTVVVTFMITLCGNDTSVLKKHIGTIPLLLKVILLNASYDSLKL